MGKAEGLMAPVHPGEILREAFMKPLGLSLNKLALELHVPATRIGEIVHERRRITAETALRLARYFKTNAEFWLNLQNLIKQSPKGCGTQELLSALRVSHPPGQALSRKLTLVTANAREFGRVKGLDWEDWGRA